MDIMCFLFDDAVSSHGIDNLFNQWVNVVGRKKKGFAREKEREREPSNKEWFGLMVMMILITRLTR
jgi:hypothetical protein